MQIKSSSGVCECMRVTAFQLECECVSAHRLIYTDKSE